MFEMFWVGSRSNYQNIGATSAAIDCVNDELARKEGIEMMEDMLRRPLINWDKKDEDDQRCYQEFNKQKQIHSIFIVGHITHIGQLLAFNHSLFKL